MQTFTLIPNPPTAETPNPQNTATNNGFIQYETGRLGPDQLEEPDGEKVAVLDRTRTYAIKKTAVAGVKGLTFEPVTKFNVTVTTIINTGHGNTLDLSGETTCGLLTKDAEGNLIYPDIQDDTGTCASVSGTYSPSMVGKKYTRKLNVITIK